MARKLYIYDKTSVEDRRQADGRFNAGIYAYEDVHTIPVTSEQDLMGQLDDLVRRHATFERALFQTHGHPGGIWINNDLVTALGLLNDFAPRSYFRLFPAPARIYFDGCNVADTDDGWAFLAAAGSTFLRFAGGEVMGFTSLGFGMPGWLPFIGGHTLHVWGDNRKLKIGPGGFNLGAEPRYPTQYVTEGGLM